MAQDATATLNALIQVCKDGEYGFGSAADHAESVDLKEVFTRRAAECQQAAAELQRAVVGLGGTAEDGSSAAGVAHRGWIAVKSAVAGTTDLAILEEAEAGEDKALSSYRTASSEGLPGELQSLVERQFEGVKRNHALIRHLRDQARSRPAG